MTDNMLILIQSAKKAFPNFTGRIVIDMFQGDVGSTEKTEKKRYEISKKSTSSFDVIKNLPE